MGRAGVPPASGGTSRAADDAAARDARRLAGETPARRFELRVAPEDVDDADVVINELYGVAYAERVWPRDDAPPVERNWCPECGARQVRHLPKLRIFVFALVGMLVLDAASSGLVGLGGFYFVAALGIALAVMEPYRCSNCEASWR
jgi:hypothetical protein